MRAIKSFLVSLALLISVLHVKAQSNEGAISIDMLANMIPPPTDTISKTIIDNEVHRVVYRVRHWINPIDTFKVREEDYILQIGEKYSQYWPLRWLNADLNFDKEIKAGTATSQTELRRVKQRNIIKEPEVILHSFADQSITTRIEPPFNGVYEYNEPMPKLDWKLVEGDSVISDYTCQRALLNFRGRDFIAWYAPDVELSAGPVRFAGLPGLIFCIYDTKGYYRYDLIGLERGQAPIYKQEVKRNLSKTSRKRAREVNQLCHDSYQAAISLSGKTVIIKNEDGSTAADQSFPFVPLELE